MHTASNTSFTPDGGLFMPFTSVTSFLVRVSRARRADSSMGMASAKSLSHSSYTNQHRQAELARTGQGLSTLGRVAVLCKKNVCVRKLAAYLILLLAQKCLVGVDELQAYFGINAWEISQELGGHSVQGIPGPLAEPVNGGAVDQAGELAQPLSELSSHRAEAQHHAWPHLLQEEAVELVLIAVHACSLGPGADVLKGGGQVQPGSDPAKAKLAPVSRSGDLIGSEVALRPKNGLQKAQDPCLVSHVTTAAAKSVGYFPSCNCI
ncbi:MAG: hypothetical protein FRX49_04188 [Trebouxia sp. A1-2]|nr:MAG: hypothetical protein FRX49_04188 [Trebouxia sp. A1-2]